MIIVGAKGFAVQIHDVLFRSATDKKFVFFDDTLDELTRPISGSVYNFKI